MQRYPICSIGGTLALCRVREYLTNIVCGPKAPDHSLQGKLRNAEGRNASESLFLQPRILMQKNGAKLRDILGPFQKLHFLQKDEQKNSIWRFPHINCRGLSGIKTLRFIKR